MSSPFDAVTEYVIEHSDSDVDVDGYRDGEPMRLRCGACGASVLLTREPSAGVDDLAHDPDCLQRFARTDWWRERFE